MFIVPGLIAMAMAQAVYSNNSSSIFQARNDRYIDDVLAAPMHSWQMNLGFAVGGVFRALLIGIALIALAVPLTGCSDRAAAGADRSGRSARWPASGRSGTIVGIFAQTFDHISFINNIVILPLTFLGGVFYSVDQPRRARGSRSPTPTPSSTWSRRSATASSGTSDVSPWLAFGVMVAIAAGLIAWSQYLFASGRRLKP